MPKNKFGGSRHKKSKTLVVEETDKNIQYPVIEGTIEQHIAEVKQNLGGSRLLLLCDDGKERQGIISGKFRKRVYMRSGDIVLIDVGSTGKSTEGHIIYKYNGKEIMRLGKESFLSFIKDPDHEDADLILIIDDDMDKRDRTGLDDI